MRFREFYDTIKDKYIFVCIISNDKSRYGELKSFKGEFYDSEIRAFNFGLFLDKPLCVLEIEQKNV